MNLSTFIEELNDDLSREYAHWHFYMNAALVVQGLHRTEIQEFLLDAAAGEMKHVEEWGRVILGLGGIPTVNAAPFRSDLTDPWDILEAALVMEEEVVVNYVTRMEQAVELQKNSEHGNPEDKVHGRYVELFLENQLLDSRGDIDNLLEMTKRPARASDIKCVITAAAHSSSSRNGTQGKKELEPERSHYHM